MVQTSDANIVDILVYFYCMLTVWRSRSCVCVRVCALLDRVGLTDVSTVDLVRQRLLSAMDLQLGRNHPQEPALLSTVLSFLPCLRMLSAAHFAQLEWYQLNWRHLPGLPPLFAEIHDIPTSPEDEEDNAANLAVSAAIGSG